MYLLRKLWVSRVVKKNVKSLDDIKQTVLAWAWGGEKGRGEWGGENGEGLPPAMVFSFGGDEMFWK